VAVSEQDFVGAPKVSLITDLPDDLGGGVLPMSYVHIGGDVRQMAHDIAAFQNRVLDAFDDLCVNDGVDLEAFQRVVEEHYVARGAKKGTFTVRTELGDRGPMHVIAWIDWLSKDEDTNEQ